MLIFPSNNNNNRAANLHSHKNIKVQVSNLDSLTSI